MDEHSHAFVVKIWAEERGIAGAGPLWRGYVDDVQSGTRLYFRTLVELCDHLGKQTGMSMARSRTPRRLPARTGHWHVGGHDDQPPRPG